VVPRGALALVAALVLCAGCYESHGDAVSPPPPRPGVDAGPRVVPPPPPPMRPDAGPPFMPPPPPPPPPPGGPTTFIVSEMSVPVPTGSGVTVGANIDGIDSGFGSVDPNASCEEFQPDGVSRNDMLTGIDNAYAGLVPTLEAITGEPVDARLQRAIEEGDALLLIELVGEPPRVLTVELAEAVDELRFEPDGSLSPGQRFRVVETITAGMIAVGPGGRFTAFLERFRAPLTPELESILPIGNLDRGQLRFNLSTEGIVLGELGGSFTLEDAANALTMGDPSLFMTVVSVLEAIADISPSGVDPAVCESISVGVAFSAVPAIREG